MARRRPYPRHKEAWRDECHRRGDDACAWPPIFGLVRAADPGACSPCCTWQSCRNSCGGRGSTSNLGTFSVEPRDIAHRAIDGERGSAARGLSRPALLRLAAERDPHQRFIETAVKIAGGYRQTGKRGPAYRGALRPRCLSQMGFRSRSRDMRATGATTDLIYVSPKSGALSRRWRAKPIKHGSCRCRLFCETEQGGDPPSRRHPGWLSD